VIPRERAEPQGKRSRARTETFATHVDLEQILVRGAPTTVASRPRAAAQAGDPDPAADRDGEPGPDRDEPAPVRSPGRDARDEAPTRADRTDPTPVRPRALRSAEFPEVTAANAGTAPSSTVTPADPDAPGAERPAQPTLQLPGRTAPSGALLQIAAIGALILGGVAIVAFLRGRGAIDAPDAAPRRDATHAAIDTAADAQVVSTTAPPDATEADAAPADTAAPAPPLAGVPAPPHDAGVRPPRPDAREPGELPPRPDAGAARPTGTATLTVGAIPWGTVLLDGRSIGRTPIERLTVPAGHHTIQVTFAGEDPPRTQSYAVDLAAGENKDLVADFTRP
jgi:hypothetical protein